MNQILVVALLTYAIHLLLKLNLWATIAVCIVLAGTAWCIQRGKQRARSQYDRLQEVSNYLDLVLPCFAREGKIDLALENAANATARTSLQETLVEAGTRISTSLSEEPYRDGLNAVHDSYPCERIRKVNDFMLHAEYYGGEMAESVKLLLEDGKHWKDRCQWACEERKTAYRNILLSVAMSLLICSMILHLPVMEMDVSTNPIIQGIAVITLILDAGIVLAGQRYLQTSWINLDEDKAGRDYAVEMSEFRSFDEHKERKWSWIVAGVFALAGGIAFFYNRPWIALLMFTLGVFTMNQHMLGHTLKKHRITRQLRRDFPIWLMDVALLLQGENVQIAMEKSLERAPDILKQDIQALLARLELQPESFEPYQYFLQEFEIPEIQSAMSILYALSVGTGTVQDRRIEELIETNNQMIESAEREWLKDRNSGMYLLFLAPVVTASAKLLTDMAIFMIGFLSSGLL